jgi:hypothetical protein
MKFNKLVNEIYDTNINKQYGATNSAPRKDFAPASSKDGYINDYQNLGASELENPQPDNPASYPWEIQTINDDLANGFVSIVSSAEKIKNAYKNNNVLNINQKNDFKNLYKLSKNILNAIKKVAFKIDEIANLNLEKTPEIKMNAAQDNNPTHLKRTEVKIKIPNKD